MLHVCSWKYVYILIALNFGSSCSHKYNCIIYFNLYNDFSIHVDKIYCKKIQDETSMKQTSVLFFTIIFFEQMEWNSSAITKVFVKRGRLGMLIDWVTILGTCLDLSARSTSCCKSELSFFFLFLLSSLKIYGVMPTSAASCFSALNNYC